MGQTIEEIKLRDIYGVTTHTGRRRCILLHLYEKVEHYPTTCCCCKSKDVTYRREERTIALKAPHNITDGHERETEWQ